jgi:hypothetical protein
MKRLLIIILSIFVLITVAILSSNYIENRNLETTNDFYNTAFLISTNTYVRVYSLPLKTSLDEVNSYKKDIEGFYEEYKSLKTTKETLEGEVVLDNLFRISYEIIKDCEEILSSNQYMDNNDVVNKSFEAEKYYLELEAVINKKGIKISPEVKSEATNLILKRW